MVNVMFRPMLATDAELDKLRFPLLASAKLDGIRAIVRDGVVFSRSNKLIPNGHVQRLFGKRTHFDGELIVGDPTSKTVYNDTTSGVMSMDGEPDVRFFVFDHIGQMTAEYTRRLVALGQRDKMPPSVVLHQQHMIADMDQLLQCEQDMLDQGYEGLILRSPDAPYKCGRSTVREGYLLKLKRFVDDEARVIGFEERMHNGNEATTNELGRTKRSSHKENKTGRGDLGALICVTKDDVQFNIGTGFTDAQRADIWANRDEYIHKLAKYKYFPVGVKDAPRHPVFLGWRNEIDT